MSLPLIQVKICEEGSFLISDLQIINPGIKVMHPVSENCFSQSFYCGVVAIPGQKKPCLNLREKESECLGAQTET